MTEWLTFEGVIEPHSRGQSTYTILRLPHGVAEALGAVRRVEVEIEDHPANLALSRAVDVEGPFLWTGKSLLGRTGLSRPTGAAAST